jgi:hypothetical protein
MTQCVPSRSSRKLVKVLLLKRGIYFVAEVDDDDFVLLLVR